MSARLLVGLVILVAVVAAPAATGVPSVVSAVGEITGPDANGDMTLTVRNTGTEPILCFRLQVPGSVKVVASRDISSEWRLVSSVVTPPTPDIGARSPNGPGIPPGGSVSLVFRTDPAYPVNGGGVLVVTASPNCSPVVQAPVSGPPPPTPPPPPPPPPPPKPKPKCKCLAVDVLRVDPDRLNGGLRLYVDWTMRCSRQAKGRCEGKLEVVPPSKKFAVEMFPKNGELICKGTCKRKANKGRTTVDFGFKQRTDGDFWNGQSFYVRFKTYCKTESGYVANGTQSATIAFGEDGRIDLVQSDRNANGKPDGDEKK